MFGFDFVEVVDGKLMAGVLFEEDRLVIDLFNHFIINLKYKSNSNEEQGKTNQLRQKKTHLR